MVWTQRSWRPTAKSLSRPAKLGRDANAGEAWWTLARFRSSPESDPGNLQCGGSPASNFFPPGREDGRKRSKGDLAGKV